MIPPSVMLVLYAILAEQNIAKLFAAALIPGLIATVGYCIAIAVYVRFRPQEGPAERAPQRGRTAGGAEGRLAGGRDLRARLRRHLWRLVHPDGGRGDRRGRHLRRRPRCAANSTLRRHHAPASTTPPMTSGMIFMLFLGADILNSTLALSQFPAALSGVIENSGLPPLAVDRRHPDLLRRPRLRDGRALDDPADAADLPADGRRPRPVRPRPDRQDRSGSASWC